MLPSPDRTAQGSLVVAVPGLWSTGPIVVAHSLSSQQHVGSSQIRDETCVPRIARQILYHLDTKEVHYLHLNSVSFLFNGQSIKSHKMVCSTRSIRQVDKFPFPTLTIIASKYFGHV